MLKIAYQSLWNRRFIAALTLCALALSVALMLGVERLRDSARQSFANAASGVDLIVAPRGNDVQILMATVFGVGSTGSGMSWHSLQELRSLPAVAWAVPLMMGDNHRGHPVIGTEASYFVHFRHSNKQPLTFASGAAFADPDEAVIGAELQKRFGYEVGTKIVNAHGVGAVAFDMHDDAPFTVAGVLAPTGTAVDRMVFVSLEGFEALHAPRAPLLADPLARLGTDKPAGEASAATLQWQDTPAQASGDEEAPTFVPQQLNGVYVGLQNRSAVLAVQRHLATYETEALSAVMPNVALLQLWSITGTAEQALRVMAAAVALAGMIGMVVMLSAALETRRREFAILRSVGATPLHVFGLIVLEAALLTLLALVLGLCLLWASTLAANPIVFDQFGFRMQMDFFAQGDLKRLIAIFCFGMLASLLPAWRMYRMTLADGLTTRL
ncbi:ABC transporter permease [Shimia marina]|uniref:Acidobacterial duplicated orphan permease n=1 Tax=Shimia marina TaxID=321267 RepID=A0A0P1ERK9_9RHOB|nr:ABC transporter permease [Shimia marina]CUH52914.1 acidobacterial duplicated orphan permease [Shimia marina]SFD90093.1 putative ABC transport system permease protein [Shimia marina]